MKAVSSSIILLHENIFGLNHWDFNLKSSMSCPQTILLKSARCYSSEGLKGSQLLNSIEKRSLRRLRNCKSHLLQSHLNLFQFFYPEPEEKRGGRWLRKMKERYAITDTTRLATGCYNLLCSGFIQINSEIAMGASISLISAFRNSQRDIGILVWKDPKEGIPYEYPCLEPLSMHRE
ncbi:hypothetical protein VitviT2T_011235 [Vitis vinifera]|uniref:Neprosin PEP catalytic domain-containing protein n=2 Tax=Vitis vinifera TaxID=29760 RepID=A0ABY9CDK3_VITVI